MEHGGCSNDESWLCRGSIGSIYPNEHPYMELQVWETVNLGCSQKRDLGAFSGHLSFMVNGVESPLFFIQKNKRK